MGDYVTIVSAQVSIYLDLRDYLNQTYTLSPAEGCDFRNSYYTQNG